MEIGKRIETIRKDAGMTQETFAQAVGVSRQTVGKWETGQAQPDAGSVAAIAQTFGVSCDELLLGKNPRAESSVERMGLQRRRFGLGLLLTGLGVLGLLVIYFDVRVGSGFYFTFWRGLLGPNAPSVYTKWIFLFFLLTGAAGLWLCVRACSCKKG